MKVQKSSISGKKNKSKNTHSICPIKQIMKKLMNWLFILSKVRVFISLQMTHIRHWGIIPQSTLDLSLLSLFDQLAKSSTTLHDMTQWTQNSEQAIFQGSWDTGQCRCKWSVISPFLLHIQDQSTTTTFRLLKLSMVEIFPKAAV